MGSILPAPHAVLPTSVPVYFCPLLLFNFFPCSRLLIFMFHALLKVFVWYMDFSLAFCSCSMLFFWTFLAWWSTWLPFSVLLFLLLGSAPCNVCHWKKWHLSFNVHCYDQLENLKILEINSGCFLWPYIKLKPTLLGVIKNDAIFFNVSL